MEQKGERVVKKEALQLHLRDHDDEARMDSREGGEPHTPLPIAAINHHRGQPAPPLAHDFIATFLRRPRKKASPPRRGCDVSVHSNPATSSPLLRFRPTRPTHHPTHPPHVTPTPSTGPLPGARSVGKAHPVHLIHPSHRREQLCITMSKWLTTLLLAGSCAASVHGWAHCDTSAKEREGITKAAVRRLDASGDFEVIEVRGGMNCVMSNQRPIRTEYGPPTPCMDAAAAIHPQARCTDAQGTRVWKCAALSTPPSIHPEAHPSLETQPTHPPLQGTLTFNHRQIGNPAGRYGTVSFPSWSQPLVRTGESLVLCCCGSACWMDESRFPPPHL